MRTANPADILIEARHRFNEDLAGGRKNFDQELTPFKWEDLKPGIQQAYLDLAAQDLALEYAGGAR